MWLSIKNEGILAGVGDEDQKRTARKSARLGASGEVVRQRIREVRDAQGVTGAQLSARLNDLGRPIPLLGIQRIESGERRVDVDDLVAIAVALEVSPTTFMLPNSNDRNDRVTATGLATEPTAEQLWDWLRVDHYIDRAKNGMEQLDFIKRAAPVWRALQYADGVLQLLELNRIERDMKSTDEVVAAEARRRFEEIQAEYDRGDD